MSRGLDRARAARYVETRLGELGLTREELADRANIDRKTLYNLLSGERWPQAKTRAALEKALGWYTGDLLRVAEGAEPVTYVRPPTGRELLSDFAENRRQELDLDWDTVARDAGMTSNEVAELRRTWDPGPAFRRGLERALRWEPGSIDLIFDEGRAPATLEAWRASRQSAAEEIAGLREMAEMAERLKKLEDAALHRQEEGGTEKEGHQGVG